MGPTPKRPKLILNTMAPEVPEPIPDLNTRPPQAMTNSRLPKTHTITKNL